MEWLECRIGIFALLLSFWWLAIGDAKEPRALIVVGAVGEEAYGEQFREWANRWEALFEKTEVNVVGRGSDPTSEAGAKADRELILSWFAQLNQSDATDTTTPNWLVLIGHGTHDRSAAKFNLRGPDISADDISKAIGSSKKRWVIVDCSSSSGPFISTLSGENRIVITATKSGSEQNYSRFGDYFSKAIVDPASDLDHDSCVSVLEAFLAASSGVARFYSDEGRLASEQALLDDNGDHKGTPAAFFRGIRPVKAPADGLKLDGTIAKRVILFRFGEQRQMTAVDQSNIESIEAEIETLRSKKEAMNIDEYYQELEKLLLRIAALMDG